MYVCVPLFILYALSQIFTRFQYVCDCISHVCFDTFSLDSISRGFNYHNGPEWVWPTGYFLRALHKFSEARHDTRQVHSACHRTVIVLLILCSNVSRFRMALGHSNFTHQRKHPLEMLLKHTGWKRHLGNSCPFWKTFGKEFVEGLQSSCLLSWCMNITEINAGVHVICQGLPELCNENGSDCPDSCPTQVFTTL